MIKADSYKTGADSNFISEAKPAQQTEFKSDVKKYDTIFSNLSLEGYKYSSSLRCIVYDYLRGKITKDEMEGRINGNSK